MVAINDVAEKEPLAYLLKHDTVMGQFDEEVRLEEGYLRAGQQRSRLTKGREPAKLPWKDLGVDIVVESTGRFTDREGASKHLSAGAKRVIITAPSKDPDVTVVLGVNEKDYDPSKHAIVSNASCTTNCLAPVAKVLLEQFGIKPAP